MKIGRRDRRVLWIGGGAIAVALYAAYSGANQLQPDAVYVGMMAFVLLLVILEARKHVRKRNRTNRRKACAETVGNGHRNADADERQDRCARDAMLPERGNVIYGHYVVLDVCVFDQGYDLGESHSDFCRRMTDEPDREKG